MNKVSSTLLCKNRIHLLRAHLKKNVPLEERDGLSRTHLYILLGILAIAILGLVGYIVWDMYQEPESSTIDEPISSSVDTSTADTDSNVENNNSETDEDNLEEVAYVTDIIDCELPEYISSINTTYPEGVTVDTEYQDNGTTIWSCKVIYSYMGATMTYWVFLGVDYNEGLSDGYSTLTTINGRELVKNPLSQTNEGTWETGYGEYKGTRTCDPLDNQSPYPCPNDPFLYDIEFAVVIPTTSYDDSEDIMSVFDNIVRKLSTE